MQPSAFGERHVTAASEQEARGSRSQTRLTRLGATWIGGAVAVSVLLVVATAAHVYYDPSGILGYVLHRLDLEGENNPAATWSGILLAITSAHAFDGYARERLRNRDAALGWALIALVLLALSADEMGSIHERIWLLADNPWPRLLPFALVLGGMLAYGLVALWRTQEYRRTVLYLVLGFTLLSSAALHEFIEDQVDWTTAGAEAFASAFEEGSELCGMLVVLQIVVRNTARLAASRAPGYPAFEAVWQLRRPLVAVALVLMPILAYLGVALTDYQRGQPANWAAAMLFVAAALAAVRTFFAIGTRLSWSRWALCALCGLGLAVAIDIEATRVVEFGGFAANLRLLLFGAIASLACATWLFEPEVHGRPFALIGAIMLAVLAVVSLLPPGLFAVYGVSQLTGLAVFLTTTAAAEEARHRRAADRALQKMAALERVRPAVNSSAASSDSRSALVAGLWTRL